MLSEGKAPAEGRLRDFLYAFLDEKDEDDLANAVVEAFPEDLLNGHAPQIFTAIVKRTR